MMKPNQTTPSNQGVLSSLLVPHSKLRAIIHIIKGLSGSLNTAPLSPVANLGVVLIKRAL